MQKTTRTPAAKTPQNGAASSRIPRWAGRLLLAVVAPVLFALATEGVLRVGGFGRDLRFFVPDDRPGVYRTNPHFTEICFPASFGLKPVNYRLARHKDPGIIRVFVAGESAAMGVPEPGFGLPVQLQAQLEAMYPGKRFEVFNLGVTAINSHVMRLIVNQALDFEPDALVIYAGNNEVVGPYGPSSVSGNRMMPLPLVRLSLWLRGTRTGQAVQWLVAKTRVNRAGAAPDWRGMESFAGNTVAATDPRLLQVADYFGRNLEGILAQAKTRGVKVLVSTVPVNLRDFSPFVSLHRSGLSEEDLRQWQAAFAQGKYLAELGRNEEARQNFTRALSLDSEYADLHFELGRLLDQQGKLELAKREYLDALEWDALRFRADRRINETIRKVARAAGTGVVVADVEAAWREGTQLAGRDYFFEHVHLRFEGNRELARTLAVETGRLVFDAGPTAAARPGEVEAALGFTAFGRSLMPERMDELTARPPFTGKSGFARERSTLLREIGETSAELQRAGAALEIESQLQASRRAHPQNAFPVRQLALWKAQRREYAGALELLDALEIMEPASAEVVVQRAYVLGGLKRFAEAEKLLLSSVELEPYYLQTYVLLAQVWSAQGKAETARTYFGELTRKMPQSRGVRLLYANILEGMRDSAAAEEQRRAVLALVPDEEGALAPLVDRLLARGARDEALALMARAFAYNPRNFANDARLVELYDEKGDVANTVACMQAMEESGPVNARLHLDLAERLTRLGRSDESALEMVRANRAAREEGNQNAPQAVERRGMN